MDKLRQLIQKDPLFEFLFFGFLLYIIYTLMTPQEESQTKEDIIIQKAKVAQQFPFDINTSLTLATYQNVLLYESYFLELYKQDPKISQLLIDKEKLLLQSSLTLQEPSEENLKKFFLQHKNNYLPAQSYSFYLLPLQDKTLIEQLNLFNLLPQNKKLFSNLSKDTIISKCGNYFYHQLKQLSLHFWSQPIQCQDKRYSIYIIKKTPATDDISFEEVEALVYKDYLYQERKKAYLKAYKNILQHYNIKEQ